VEHTEALLAESIDLSRNLTTELSPPILHDAGLGPALDWLARQFNANYALEITIDAPAEMEKVSEAVRTFLFLVARELLFNAAKHAKTKRVCVTLRNPAGQLVLQVCDEGAGFDPARMEKGAAVSDRFGLFNIRERIEMFGGEFRIDSKPGQGTRTTVTVPIPAPRPAR
jgi:signal transduction histidine kinase